MESITISGIAYTNEDITRAVNMVTKNCDYSAKTVITLFVGELTNDTMLMIIDHNVLSNLLSMRYFTELEYSNVTGTLLAFRLTHLLYQLLGVRDHYSVYSVRHMIYAIIANTIHDTFESELSLSRLKQQCLQNVATYLGMSLAQVFRMILHANCPTYMLSVDNTHNNNTRTPIESFVAVVTELVFVAIKYKHVNYQEYINYLCWRTSIGIEYNDYFDTLMGKHVDIYARHVRPPTAKIMNERWILLGQHCMTASNMMNCNDATEINKLFARIYVSNDVLDEIFTPQQKQLIDLNHCYNLQFVNDMNKSWL